MARGGWKKKEFLRRGAVPPPDFAAQVWGIGEVEVRSDSPGHETLPKQSFGIEAADIHCPKPRWNPELLVEEELQGSRCDTAGGRQAGRVVFGTPRQVQPIGNGLQSRTHSWPAPLRAAWQNDNTPQTVSYHAPLE